MTLHWGGTPTSMWWDGDVTAVYAGADLVWEAIITVTPEPPIFHDGEPWVTLPDMEGVAYTVQGTTGYGQTVTVTATAQDGYALDGTTEWEHTFPSIEPVSGDYEDTLPNGRGGITIVASHAIEWDYEYVIEHTASTELSILLIAAGIGVNDVIVAEGPDGQHSTSTYTATLQAGDTVYMGVRNQVGIGVTVIGTWSITPA